MDLIISLSRGELLLLHNGLPVPGSYTSAQQIVKHGVYALNAMALLTLLLGAYAVFALEDMNLLNDSVMFGSCAFLFVLCSFYLKKGKKLAAIAGLFLSFLYVWFWVIFIANQFNNFAALLFLALHVYLVMKVIKAIPAIGRFNLYITPE